MKSVLAFSLCQGVNHTPNGSRGWGSCLFFYYLSYDILRSIIRFARVVSHHLQSFKPATPTGDSRGTATAAHCTRKKWYCGPTQGCHAACCMLHDTLGFYDRGLVCNVSSCVCSVHTFWCRSGKVLLGTWNTLLAWFLKRPGPSRILLSLLDTITTRL